MFKNNPFIIKYSFPKTSTDLVKLSENYFIRRKQIAKKYILSSFTKINKILKIHLYKYPSEIDFLFTVLKLKH